MTKKFVCLKKSFLFYAAGFGADINAGAAITAVQFSVATIASNDRQRFIYDNISSALFFEADGSEAIAQVQIATLYSGLALTNNDIVVV